MNRLYFFLIFTLVQTIGFRQLVRAECDLDHPDGRNITAGNFYTEKDCLVKLCDMYGPENARAGTASICVFGGKIIKNYPVIPKRVVNGPVHHEQSLEAVLINGWTGTDDI